MANDQNQPDLFDDSFYSPMDPSQQGQGSSYSSPEAIPTYSPGQSYGIPSSRSSQSPVNGASPNAFRSPDTAYRHASAPYQHSSQPNWGQYTSQPNGSNPTPDFIAQPAYRVPVRPTRNARPLPQCPQVPLFDDDDPFQFVPDDYGSQMPAPKERSDSAQPYSVPLHPFGEQSSIDRKPSKGEMEDPSTDETEPASDRLSHTVSPKKKTQDPERQRKRTSAFRILSLLIGLAALLFIVIFGSKLLKELHQNEFDGQLLEEQIQQKEQEASGNPVVTAVPKTVYDFPENEVYSSTERFHLSQYPENPTTNLLPEMAEYQRTYADIQGRLTIDGLLDELIFQNNGLFYLTHDGYGNTTDNGSVYISSEITFAKNPPESIVLHGLSATGIGALAGLQNFISAGENYARTFNKARLLTSYAHESYVLFSVFQFNTNSPDAFPADEYIHFASDRAMMDFVAEVKQRSLYALNIPVEPEDRLLTISTVSPDGNCIVLVYRAFRPGEAY